MHIRVRLATEGRPPDGVGGTEGGKAQSPVGVEMLMRSDCVVSHGLWSVSSLSD